jgi:uncharacterized protein (TIGR00251 family)
VPEGRLRLRVRLTPRGRRDLIDGFAANAGGQQVLKVRVAAPPVEGAANRALVRLLARTLGVARSAVTIVSGETSRAKMVEIAGDPADLEGRLAEIGRAP